MYAEDDYLPLSGLQHLAYCERQWALIHLEGVWSESTDTLRGDYFHERVDTIGYSCADGVRAERRVRLASAWHGLYGIADIVEFYSDDGVARARPVEYKVGRPKKEAWDRIQLAAQALCIEEMYQIAVSEGAIFYGETRRRESVSLDEGLRQTVADLSERMHRLFDEGRTPVVVENSRCRRCSLKDDCLPPKAAKSVASYWQEMGEGW